MASASDTDPLYLHNNDCSGQECLPHSASGLRFEFEHRADSSILFVPSTTIYESILKAELPAQICLRASAQPGKLERNHSMPIAPSMIQSRRQECLPAFVLPGFVLGQSMANWRDAVDAETLLGIASS